MSHIPIYKAQICQGCYTTHDELACPVCKSKAMLSVDEVLRGYLAHKVTK